MTDAHREALEAAARAEAIMLCCGEEGCYCLHSSAPPGWGEDDCEAWPSIDTARAAILAFLSKLEEQGPSDATIAAIQRSEEWSSFWSPDDAKALARAVIAQLRKEME